MEQQNLPNHPSPLDIELDRLSSLPEHIIDHILLQLPIRDAVRTSVMSTKWRYKWATLSSLDFDDRSISLDSQDHAVIKSKLGNIIDHVLLVHSGPIYKFKLSLQNLIGGTEIERWLLHLSNSQIREFILEIRKGQRYKLHSCLFSWQNLTHLELLNCLLKPPRTIHGFKNLKSLKLKNVTMEQDVFDNLISGCPLLERLKLWDFDGFGRLNIDASNLLFVEIYGIFDDVTFTNTYQLANISIGSSAEDRTCSLLNFFVHLPHIQNLKIHVYFLKNLAAGDVPSRLPNSCVDLSYLSLDIDFNDREENKAAFCLLRSSPNLQELNILGNVEERSPTESSASFWQDEDRSCLFNQLRLVEIRNIAGTRFELDFIRFLLLTSPALDRMTIKPASTYGGLTMTKKLLQFQRASAQAKIVYLDP